ncbi:cupredoxin family copper-binding protein [Streptomyces sp. NPDC058424]|uniref:cupredoxin domain-containing protein n=1 Tax=Streptomyces sp. NPDC058424 TaxID=3346491 RepID=UPI00365205CB
MTMNAISSPPARRSRTAYLTAVAVAGALGLLSACGGSSHPKPAGTVTPPPITPSTSPTSGQPSAARAANAVTIKNFAFSPAKLTVKAGTKVTWTNTDQDTHTVTSKKGSGGPLKSGGLTTNATYSYTFTKPGTYAYYCTIHPFMTATVEVTP